MAAIGDLFGEGTTARQLFEWTVLGAVFEALASPALQEVQGIALSTFPNTKLSPADAAKAVVRNYLADADGVAEAMFAGIDEARFNILRDIAGVAPGAQQLAEALRREVIPESGAGADSISFEQGIRETDLLDKWTPVVKALALLWPSPADVIDAVVKGQIPRDQGLSTFQRVGGDPQWFDLLVNTNGNPPSPTELLELAARGVIPWHGTGPDALTFQQGIFEGRTKDKWEPAYEALFTYFPTVAEVVELYRWGQLDVPQATGFMTRRGLTPDQAAWWINYANANAINDFRGLTEQSVLAQLSTGFITDAQARTMLGALHRGTATIDELISYAHIQRAITSVGRAVTRVATLYQSRKITREAATTALTTLKVDPAAIPEVIADWDAVAGINVRVLTEAQIVDAWFLEIIDQGTAEQELQNIGYTPYDAWVLLSIKNKSALPNPPPQIIGAAPGTVAPGTT